MKTTWSGASKSRPRRIRSGRKNSTRAYYSSESTPIWEVSLQNATHYFDHQSVQLCIGCFWKNNASNIITVISPWPNLFALWKMMSCFYCRHLPLHASQPPDPIARCTFRRGGVEQWGMGQARHRWTSYGCADICCPKSLDLWSTIGCRSALGTGPSCCSV